MNNGVGGQACIFPTNDTVIIKPENHIYTHDLVLKPEATQEYVYEVVGKKTVDDVLNGYNGTLFTYGQTGSGKTYTLVGDMMSYETKGIIGRAMYHHHHHHHLNSISSLTPNSEHIFTHI